MLSNPCSSASSAGSSVRTSTSTPRRSRIAFAYSARFRRWTAGRPGFGGRRRRTIQRRLQRRHEGDGLRRIRPRPANWRHRAGPHLADDLFPLAGVRANLRHVDVVQRQPRRLEPLVVARDAVSGQEFPIEGEGWLRGTRRGLEGRQTGAHRSAGEHADSTANDDHPRPLLHSRFCPLSQYCRCRPNDSSRSGPDRRHLQKF